ncbi:unnamed protein product [Diatraea saccharalis]|uniref:Uncharacterized protein n=1 Tax=Diatraea saccharalis TaxID=40085 RepID=A0A9N9RFA7_9NEOP|nr:unnamed protein product [Diatraea saccharalis]
MGMVMLSLNLLHDCRFHMPRWRGSALGVNYATTAAAFVLLVGLLFVIIGGLDLNDHDDQPSALVLNDVIVIFIFVISVINIVISAFGIEYSNNPLILERLNYINNEYLNKGNVTASAGILAIVMTFLDVENSDKQKKISYTLYHASVGMMTGVVFCDVMKMTFGLDPALSVKDSLGNGTSNFYDWFFKVKE